MKSDHHSSLQQHGSRDPLRGVRVAITGGTSGLGLALVRALSTRGARIAFVARDAQRVARIAATTGTHGVTGDVARKNDIHPIALQIVGLLGGLDVLVNNASSLGPPTLRILADTECEDFEVALATNVLGPFRLTRTLLGALAASARDGTGAVVLNVSSDAAINAYSGWGAYGASKAALHHMTCIWHEELAPLGIAFANVDPGDMDTPLHTQALPDADPATLKQPVDAAREVASVLAQLLVSARARAHRPPHSGTSATDAVAAVR